MSWKITSGWAPADADAAAYITAVEAADTAAGQSGGLEQGVKIAIDNFVLGCKADGIWSAIKASCILAGARTLQGALVPLVGTAPTSFNFVAGDYNRETGLVGNGSTKYLNSNRNNNAENRDNSHIAAFVSTAGTSALARSYIGAGSNATGSRQIGATGTTLYARSYSSGTFQTFGSSSQTGFIGQSRASLSAYDVRFNRSTQQLLQSAETASSGSINILAADTSNANYFNNARIAFYSIGESLNLALLDARVTDLINAIAAAIP